MTRRLRTLARLGGLLAAILVADAAAGAEAGRYAEDVSFRQPGQPVPPRGSDVCGARSGDGPLQQSRHVRSARGASQLRLDRAGSGDRVVVGLVQDRAALPPARRRQMARRQALYRQRRQVHLGYCCSAKSSEKFRLNPRKAWYQNLEEVTVKGDHEVAFRLKRPQPSFIALLASGWSPVYPCHVPPREMRSQPIGTGPFKLVEFKPNEADQGRAKPGLLEEGPALPRRHRLHDHQEPLDRGCWRLSPASST